MYIKIRKGLFSKETRDGLLVLSQDEKEIFILNDTASMIWRLCSSHPKIDIEEVLSNVEKEYDLKAKDLKNYKKDCRSFVKQNPELFEFFEN